MAFILLFVVAAVAISVAGEIYKNGSNNVLINSLEDSKHFANRMGIGRVGSSMRTSAKDAIGFVQGTIVFIVALLAIALVIKLVFMVAAFLLGWLFS
jgi:hypothetical protein